MVPLKNGRSIDWWQFFKLLTFISILLFASFSFLQALTLKAWSVGDLFSGKWCIRARLEDGNLQYLIISFNFNRRLNNFYIECFVKIFTFWYNGKNGKEYLKYYSISLTSLTNTEQYFGLDLKFYLIQVLFRAI